MLGRHFEGKNQLNLYHIACKGKLETKKIEKKTHYLNLKSVYKQEKVNLLSDLLGFNQVCKVKTMANKLMYLPNVDKQYNPFCRLQLFVKTFGHLT